MKNIILKVILITLGVLCCQCTPDSGAGSTASHAPAGMTLRSYRGVKMDIPSHLEIRQTLSSSGQENLVVTSPQVAKISFFPTLPSMSAKSAKQLVQDLLNDLMNSEEEAASVKIIEEKTKGGILAYSGSYDEEGLRVIGAISTHSGKKIILSIENVDGADMKRVERVFGEQLVPILKSSRD